MAVDRTGGKVEVRHGAHLAFVFFGQPLAGSTAHVDDLAWPVVHPDAEIRCGGCGEPMRPEPLPGMTRPHTDCDDDCPCVWGGRPEADGN